HDSYNAIIEVKDDHYRTVILLNVRKTEAHAKVNYWHYHTAQVGHAGDKTWRVRDTSNAIASTYLLYLQNVDPIFFVTETKNQILLRNGVRARRLCRCLGHAVTPCLPNVGLTWFSFCPFIVDSSTTSRISATLPSPRMV